MLQIANVAYKQMERPDRDQTKTKEAVQKYKEMLAAYPKSQYVPEAEKHLQEALDRLARHEFIIAKFYIKRGDANAAVARLNNLIGEYPNYNERDGVFFNMAAALDMLGRKAEARLYYERVIAEFPNSEFAGRAKQKLANKA
jgi:outer membrane protein assembly factor BamD